MKKLALFMFLFTIVSCSQIIGPKISAAVTNYEFGKITQGAVVSHEFIILNNGGDTLKIKDVRAGCGCTVVKPEKTSLLPGENTKIYVTFDSKGRKGHQQKYVYVTSNDKEKPELRLSFTADIELPETGVKPEGPRIQFVYSNHDFGIIEEGKVVEWTASFKNAGNSDLVIKDVKSSCGCTAAVLSGKTIKPGESGNLKIEFDSNNKNGKISKTVTLYTNDIITPNPTIVISADVQTKKVN
ncbi:MAG: DUF1573 domain-containing protein [Ignavibacteriales bacterium]|nr:MAG: DUF1573 domain-containing protein [Ignavibacteriales bacterium]